MTMDTQPSANGTRAAGGSTRPLASLLVLGVGLVRLITTRFNFTPVGGVSVFAGARLRSWHAYALPLAVMVLTDTVLCMAHGFDYQYSPFHESRPWVYGSFLLYVLIGRALVRTESPWWIGAATVLGSVQFFLITNFYAWLALPGLYTRDLAGLWECYLAGLPFYPWTLLGDLGFAALLFGAHSWLSRTAFPAERVRLQPSTR
jgi:hypothetical protein